MEIPTISWGSRKLDSEESNNIDRKENPDIFQSKVVQGWVYLLWPLGQ